MGLLHFSSFEKGLTYSVISLERKFSTYKLCLGKNMADATFTEEVTTAILTCFFILVQLLSIYHFILSTRICMF